MADNYPGTIHRCCRVVESIALRIASISESVDGSSKNVFENLNDTKMARKASRENREIKFDECGAIQFCLQGTDLMKRLNFNEKLTESLSLLLTSVGEYLQTLLHPPQNMTRNEFEVLSRVKFGFQLVIVFGTSQITAVQKQLTAYQGYYFEKAKSDGEMIGKPLTLRNFIDSIMETKHKESKQGNFLFSGGKSGPIGKVEYQKQVLQQQFLSKYLRIETSSSYQTNVS